MVWCWWVGLLLIGLGAVAGIAGLGTKVPDVPYVHEPGNGTIAIELPSPEEAKEQQTALLRKLRASQVGLVLATVGSFASAFGTPPWSS